MRQRLVVANWKMHGSLASVRQLLQDLLHELTPSVAGRSTEVAVCAPFVHLPLALECVAGSALAVGAQNCSEHASGAYTGEISAAMLADIGCSRVIVGHSERRQYFGESSELVAAKAASARAAGLLPILCVGETLQQREQGQAEAVVAAQLRAMMESPLLASDVLAYEPVWAIGTGVTASPEQAQEMHAFIRGVLREHCGETAGRIRILYGGSVKSGNAAELFGQEDIDGGLVGGASLDAVEFAAIVNAA
jgi:triosephosphate isomerase